MSAIFKHAVAIGACPTNPVRDCTILGNTRPPGRTPHFTLEEAEDAITALIDKPDAQLIFGLAFFCGLRPSEIAALLWGDFDSDFVHIRRGVCAGVVGTPKTASSVRSIPLIGPVKILLQQWRTKSPSQKWLFPDGDKPRDITSYMNRAGARLEGGWRGLYAAAKLVASGIRDGGLALMSLMGHRSLDVTIRNYVKRVPEDLVSAMRLLESNVSQGTK